MKYPAAEQLFHFCRFVLKHEAFRKGEYDTHFVPDLFSAEKLDELENVDADVRSLAAALLTLNQDKDKEPSQQLSGNGTSKSLWWEKRGNT